MMVGVPRALLFHQYGDCWTAFLDAAGFEQVVTAPTTADMVATGGMRADNETCLPVKVFAGHLLDLKGRADVILVPRVISQRRGLKACPNYLGLPDLARSFDRRSPPVLGPVMDLADRKARWTREWYEMARDLGAGRQAALQAVRRMRDVLSRGHEEHAVLEKPSAAGPTVGIAGHLYNVRDGRVSLGLIDRIRDMGASVATAERVAVRDLRRELRTLPRKVSWESESTIVGAVLHWSRAASVDGVIYVSSFACGPGSMVGALLEDQLGREHSVPFMNIVLDEHSAEGGLITRIEAFLDMLKRVPLRARAAPSAAAEGGLA